MNSIGGKVVDVPARGNLDEIGLAAALERLHPGFGLLGVVDLGPRVADAYIVGLKIVMRMAIGFSSL